LRGFWASVLGGSAFCFSDQLLSQEVVFLSNATASHYFHLVIVKLMFPSSLLPRTTKECCSNPWRMDLGLAELLPASAQSAMCCWPLASFSVRLYAI